MSSRHKQTDSIEREFIVDSQGGMFILPHHFEHAGRTDHKFRVRFLVAQGERTDFDIKFYIMNEEAFVNWFPISLHETRTSLPHDPKDVSFSSGRVTKGDYIIDVIESGNIYLIFDNSFSSFTAKRVRLWISEEWNEEKQSLDVVTTVPPHDKSLKEDVERIINDCKMDLKIISPYIDMSLISDLLRKIEKGAQIRIITRTRQEFTGKDKKATFDHIHNNLGKNHRTNEYIHSRIIIRDGIEAVISSADLTQDSLIGQFNAGIIVSDVNVLKKLGNYFETIWQKSANG